MTEAQPQIRVDRLIRRVSVESKSIRAKERKHGFEKRRKIPFLVDLLFRVIESEKTYTKRVSELKKMINLTCRVNIICHLGNRRIQSIRRKRRICCAN